LEQRSSLQSQVRRRIIQLHRVVSKSYSVNESFELIRESITTLGALVFEVLYLYWMETGDLRPREEPRAEETMTQNLREAGTH